MKKWTIDMVLSDGGHGELEYVVPVIEDKEDYSVC